MTSSAPSVRLSPWRVGLALALVYLSWGTTYLATGHAVKSLPPALFSGVRLCLAGLVLLCFVLLSGRRATLSGRDLAWSFLVGVFMFLGGNGLISYAQKTVPSGSAAVMAATTPLWMALLERAWPTGERLRLRGWLGLLAGLAGVMLLGADQLNATVTGLGLGYLLAIGSAFCWAFGAFLQRRRLVASSVLTAAAWQLTLGDASLAFFGFCLGEGSQLTSEKFTPSAVFAFFYLLVVGSLVGFVAFTWLLGHVSVALASSHAYVNPVVALLVGWLLAGETLTLQVIAGMIVILGGVALVRSGTIHRRPLEPEPEECEPLHTAEIELMTTPGRFNVTERNRVEDRR